MTTIEKVFFKHYGKEKTEGDFTLTNRYIEFTLVDHKVSSANSALRQAFIGDLMVEGFKVTESTLSNSLSKFGDVLTLFTFTIEDQNLHKRVTRPSMKVLLGI